MERLNRAAQFAPFAALTGFEDEIEDMKDLLKDEDAEGKS